MAVIRKVTRVSNPKRRYRRSKATRNAKGRFVKITRTRNRRHTRKRNTRASTKTKSPAIRRYNVKALKSELKRRGLKVNPTRRKGVVRRHKRHTRRKQNPVLIELGSMVNPKRRKNVAKTRKRSTRKTRNPRRHAVAKVTRHRRRRYTRRRRTANPAAHTRRVHHRRRRTMNRRRHHSTRRNPALFGRSSGKDLLMMVGGGLVGVAATKYLPTLLPSQITSGLGGGAVMSIALMGAGAFAASWLAKKFVRDQSFGDAVLFGGLMQTGSAILTAFAPSALASRLALSGIGDIVPGMFVVPQNPIKDYRPPAPVAPANSGMGNLRRFGTFR
jgi:hypothetical protein